MSQRRLAGSVLLVTSVAMLVTSVALGTTVLTCQEETIHMNCPSTCVVNVLSAFYGRLDRTTCPSPYILTTSCSLPGATDLVGRLCRDKAECNFKVTTDLLGNPCYGTYRYLNVTYECRRPVTAIATGFRDFGDCAVFTDRKQGTCGEVTSSNIPLDFLLRANVSRCQNEARIRLVVKDGDCSDKNQVHVDTMEKSVGRGAFDGYFLRCELTKTEKPGGDLSLCSFCCQCPTRGCDFVFVRIFGRYGPVRSLCEVELIYP